MHLQRHWEFLQRAHYHVLAIRYVFEPSVLTWYKFVVLFSIWRHHALRCHRWRLRYLSFWHEWCDNRNCFPQRRSRRQTLRQTPLFWMRHWPNCLVRKTHRLCQIYLYYQSLENIFWLIRQIYQDWLVLLWQFFALLLWLYLYCCQKESEYVQFHAYWLMNFGHLVVLVSLLHR